MMRPIADMVSHRRHPCQSALGLAEDITPCSTLKANLPASGLDRLCYKNGSFVLAPQELATHEHQISRANCFNERVHPRSGDEQGPHAETSSGGPTDGA